MFPRLAVLFATLSAACGTTPAQPTTSEVDAAAPDADVGELARRYLGGFTTAKQANANTSFTHVNYFACAVTMTDAAGRPVGDGKTYIYEQRNFQGRAVHLQRIVAIYRTADGTIDTAIYRTTDDARLLGTCRKAESERVLRVTDLSATPCDQYYVREGDTFVGETGPNGCPSTWMGASLIKSKAIHFGEMIHVWGRFYDAQGNQVGGVGDDPYIYERFPEGELNPAL